MFLLEFNSSIFFPCRSFLLVTGTAFIAVAVFVVWLEVKNKGTTMVILLSLHYLRAICVNKNVFPLHIFFCN